MGGGGWWYVPKVGIRIPIYLEYLIVYHSLLACDGRPSPRHSIALATIARVGMVANFLNFASTFSIAPASSVQCMHIGLVSCWRLVV